MAQLRKRRLIWSLVWLPVWVLLLLVVMAKLAAVQRNAIIAELRQHIARGSTREAIEAACQLADMRPAPASALVEAANSANREIAVAAKSLIDDTLEHYGEQIRAKYRPSDVAYDLTAFVDALAALNDSGLGSDNAWIVATTDKLLKLANQLPSEDAPSLAAKCDAILSSLTQTSTTADANRRDPAQPPAPFIPASTIGQSTVNPPSAADLNEFLQTTPPRTSIRTPSEPTAPPAAIPSTTSRGTKRTERSVPPDFEWRTPRPSAGPSESPPLTLRIPATEANDGGAAENSLRPPLSEPKRLPEITSRFADASPQQLFKDWLAANKSDAAEIEQELARRGFGRITRPIVERYLSAKPADRAQLVEAVLSEPGAAARPWLLLLAEDADANVRLAAITVIATSRDTVLLEKAFQVALRDRDPRIAALAARLNERRTSNTRR